MQLLNREHQVPILAPNDIAVLNGEAAELARVQVLVVLRMRMTTYVVTDTHRAVGAVAENSRTFNPPIPFCIICLS